ncbi:MAG: phosphotransferase [Alcanivorax sp.]
MSTDITQDFDDWRELAGRDWSRAGPFTVEVDGDPLSAEVLLRHLPGRRLAVRARWRGDTVFAKLFFAGHQDEARREVARHRELIAAGLAVPALRHESQDAHGAILITDWVAGQSGQAALRGERGLALGEDLLDSLFSLYRAGLRQLDLHLDNFLFDGERFLVIDAGEMAPLPGGLRHEPAILDNLALFCAQTPLDLRDALVDKVIERLRREGLRDRGLAAMIRRRSNRRLRSAMKKWRRESSAIGVWAEHGEQWLYRRALPADQREALAAALRDPGSLPLIKEGSRVSVYGDDAWVIKHYREGGAKARLRARLFRTRADISWVMGWTWALLGVPTPRPVMLRRRPDGGAVIAFPRVEGAALSTLMESDRERARRVAPSVERWLARLGDTGFWHGDAKAQNILVDADDRPVFIDLDGAGFSALPARRRRQAARDQARFQRNWEQFRAPE